LAAELGYAGLSIDDLGLGVRSIATRKSHLDLFSMAGNDYREYYLCHSIDELIRHAKRAHAVLWPAIETVVRAHASWGGPIVIEGWSLDPRRVDLLDLPDVQSLWLIADRKLLEERIRRKEEFYRGASDEEKIIRRFLERSLWHNSQVRSEAERRGMGCIELRVDHSPDEVCEKCHRLLRRRS
jgi:hypothetical protein